MSQSTQTPTTTGKVRLRKEGDRWLVTFPCGCPDLSFRAYHVALTFATHHVDMLAEESRAIHELRPTHNIAGRA